MKRAGIWILFVLVLLFVVGCDKGTDKRKDIISKDKKPFTDIKEDRDSATANNINNTNNSFEEANNSNRTYSVTSFKELLAMQQNIIGVNDMNFFDITPEDIYNKIGCQIFKETVSYSSYMVYQNKIYPIGRWFGGFGIVSLQLCDFNMDGQYDLIYTDSWGSGMHRWEIGWFDFATMKDDLLFSSLGNTKYENQDVMLEPAGNNHFKLYTVKWNGEENNFDKFDYSKDELIGEVTKENNKPKVILIENINK